MAYLGVNAFGVSSLVRAASNGRQEDALDFNHFRGFWRGAYSASFHSVASATLARGSLESPFGLIQTSPAVHF